MGLVRVAATLLALSLYLVAAVAGLYALLFLWTSSQSPTQSNLLTAGALLGATALCVGVGKLLARHGGPFTGYGAGGMGKTQGPR